MTTHSGPTPSANAAGATGRSRHTRAWRGRLRTLARRAALLVALVSVLDGLAIQAVTYSVVTAVRFTDYDVAPTVRLESLPEAALVFPASTKPRPTRHGRTTTSHSIHPAYVEGAYRTVASTDEIVRFYEAELAARDWKPIDIREAHNGIGTLPARAWKKGDVVAHLTANPGPAGDPPTLGYRFRIIEVLGPEELPGFPW